MAQVFLVKTKTGFAIQKEGEKQYVKTIEPNSEESADGLKLRAHKEFSDYLIENKSQDSGEGYSPRTIVASGFVK